MLRVTEMLIICICVVKPRNQSVNEEEMSGLFSCLDNEIPNLHSVRSYILSM